MLGADRASDVCSNDPAGALFVGSNLTGAGIAASSARSEIDDRLVVLDRDVRGFGRDDARVVR
jgi:hypothetical protein